MATIAKRTDGKTGTSYQAKIRLTGYPIQSRTFKRLTDAKRWAVQTEAAMRERRHFKTVEAEKHTLRDLCERYIRDVLPGTKAEYKQTQQLRWWANQIGDHTLANVTPAMIAEARDKLARQPTRRGPSTRPATVVRYLAALSKAYSVAVKEWGWCEDNPLLKVTKPSEPRGRVRFLSDDERGRLLHACRESGHPYLYPIVVVALSTGMRSMEIRGLTWDRVDLERGRLLLEETKNGDRRVIPLAGHALDVLEEHERTLDRASPLLFPGRKAERPIEIRKHWIAALEAAGIEDFRFHDLRHSAASYLAMNGASLAEIAEVLGHRTLSMVKRYSHLSEAHTAGVVERMNQAIFAGVRQ